MAKPFKAVTREIAADELSVSLSTLDSMIASGALSAPIAIPGSRRKYWHPDVFYGELEQLLLRDPSDSQSSAKPPVTLSTKPARKTTAATNPANAARSRDAARVAKLNE